MLSEPCRPQPVAQPVDARLVETAQEDDADAFDTARLGMGGTQRRRAGGNGRENRDELPPPCMSRKEHADG